MSWQIKFYYETGNTFGSENAVGELGYEFDTQELAQEALKRMGEHYLWRFSVDAHYKDDLPQPGWWKRDPSCEGKTFSEYGINMSFNVVGNDGTEVWLYAGTYLGYFETLQSAEVIATTPDSDKNRLSFGSW